MPFFCIHCKSEIDPKFKACPFCAEPITDFLRRYLETPIDGKYQILGRLGAGGMGEVYKVLHLHLNSIRVIKLMRATIANDPGAHERFQREARMATRINHPSVAALFDFSTLDDGSRYMVWEHIEGTNLHELIDSRGPLSPRYAARLSIQALHGLEAIHRAGIIHRDISPENLMITHDDDADERVKIIDLGIAKESQNEGESMTKTGIFVGKWKYCSPEHLGMLPPGERIDGRADLYSFGIVLYEMLTGVATFQASTPHGFFMAHASEAPKPLREVNPSVAACPELEALLFRSLEKDRTKRFASAREFARALEEILPMLSDEAGATPPLPTSAEITGEPTRIAVRGDAPTVVTEPPRPQTLMAQPPVPEPLHVPPPDGGEGVKLGAIAAVLVILLAIGGWLMWPKKSPDPTPAPQAKSVASAIPTTVVPLAIDAWPWANVTSIRNADNGQTIELQGTVTTPAPIDLAPGRYEVTFSNPAFPTSITKTVVVTAGRTNAVRAEFGEVTMPDFGGGR
jgi:serine/threonine-protein kinase